MNFPIEMKLSENWKLRSSGETSYTGQELSTNPALTRQWLPVNVPTTVMGALVDNKIYTDPYFGENLKEIPVEQFKVPWWFTSVFIVDERKKDLFGNLRFDGINYKANVWLNGVLIADSTDIDGAYKRTSINISDVVHSGENILAVEVIPPKPGDFSTGFVDWNPAPPDGNVGIFRPVVLKLHRGVRLENPFVRTLVNFADPDPTAMLTVSIDVINDRTQEVTGLVKGMVGEVEIEQKVTLAAGESKEVSFSSDDFPKLIFKNPKLWWPWHLGEPHLHELNLEFIIDDDISDTAYSRFGIREVSDFWLDDIHRGYKINGKKVLIKGAGWTDDLLLRDTHEGIEAQVKYVRHMNLNCIRLEGIWGTDQYLYDLCDEYGILLMVGWSCHWEHEIHMGVPVNERYGAVYEKEDIKDVAQAWQDQVIWLRNHPSIFVWTVASDKVPVTELEEKYIETFAKYDPDRPYLNSTGGVGSDQHVIGSEDVISEISGSSGVKMLGPYDYTAPAYWYTDTKFGGAYGFNTETGPGAQPPRLSSIKKFIPADKLWPVNEVWDYHCALYEFSSFDRFTEALNERYGEPGSIEEFDIKAQAMNYELMRPMFEAFQVYKKRSTGVIQWMLNAAWPKMYWQLYDYYLNPTAAFYATKKALDPLQLIYNYGDPQVFLINDQQHPYEDLEAQIRVLDIDSKIVLQKLISVHVESDSSEPIYQINLPEDITSAWFLDLRLHDQDGKLINTNFYWLSTKKELLDYDADLGEFAYHTPSKQYADLTQLNQLPESKVEWSISILKGDVENEMKVSLLNTSDSIAFLVNFALIDTGSGEELLPVFWDDNFISLLPHEKRVLRVRYESHDDVELKAEGWNVNFVDCNE